MGKISTKSSKLVVRVGFDDKGRLKINGQLKKSANKGQNHVLELVGETLVAFLKDLTTPKPMK